MSHASNDDSGDADVTSHVPRASRPLGQLSILAGTALQDLTNTEGWTRGYEEQQAWFRGVGLAIVSAGLCVEPCRHLPHSSRT